MKESDIAIFGMSCFFPGINDLSQFWFNIVNGTGVLSKTPRECASETCYISHDDDEDPINISLLSGLNRYSISIYPTRFGLKPDIATVKDRDKILTLTVVAAALQDAGIALDNEIRKQTDVIIGRSRYDQRFTPNRRPLEDVDKPANMFSEQLNLFGKIETMKGDSATVIIAIEEAVFRLRQNLCDAVVVAGINLFHEDPSDIGETPYISSSRTTGLLLDGVDGFALSEGAAAVVLKRIAGIKSEDRHIYSIIKGIGISKGARSIAKTSSESQLSALQFAYDNSGIPPETIGYLEAHGGRESDSDIREIEAIRKCFGRLEKNQPARPMGFLKPMIGHTLAAAGMASLIKAALCLTHKIIPPALGFDKLQPEMDEAPFYVNPKVRPWIHDSSLPPRRAAINAFGLNGTNGHIFLEEVSEQNAEFNDKAIHPGLAWESELVVFCADTPQELRDKVLLLLQHLEKNDATLHLKDIAFTQVCHFVNTDTYRLALVCKDLEQLKNNLKSCYQRLNNDPIQFRDNENIYFTSNAAINPGKIACLFPGLGVLGYTDAYLEGLEKLCVHFPQVRKVFDQVDLRDGNLQEPIPTNHIFFPPNHLPETEQKKLRQLLMTPRIDQERNGRMPYEHVLPSAGVVIASFATWAFLRELDIPVDMMAGFSVGELTALCAAGSIDFDAVMPIWWQTPSENLRLTERGQLAIVNASEEQLKPLLKLYRNISVIVYMTPQSHILGGEPSEIKHAVRELNEWGIWAQILPHPAIHTHHYRETSLRTRSKLEKISVRRTNLPVYSGMSGEIYSHDEAATRETLSAIVNQPIMFWQTIKKLYRDGARVFLQVGSGTSLAPQIRSIIGEENIVVLSSHEEHCSALTQFNHICASLLTSGVTFNLGALFKYRSCQELNYEVSESYDNLSIDSDISGYREGNVFSSREHENTSSVNQDLKSSSADDERQMPFVGRIIRYRPDQEILIERTLDLKEDLFLNHHLFTYAPDVKPSSACLPVLPMAFGMEIMAEVSACLAPGYGHIGFENVRSSQWIELKDVDTLALQVSAKLLDERPEWHLRRVDAQVFLKGQTMPAMRATVLFGKQYLLSLHPKFENLENLRPPEMTAEKIYQERHLFHGPLFHCISGIMGVGDRGVIGEVTIPSASGLFRSTQHPELLTNPILMDSLAQFMIVLAIGEDWRPFPLGIEKIEIYSPPPPVGTRLPVYLQVTTDSSKRISVDYEVQNGSGMVWMRIHNWRFWVFNWTLRIVDYLRFPQKYFLCNEKQLLLLPEESVCQSICKADLPDLKLDWLARITLSLEEMNTFFSLSENPQHQHHWFYGQLAAKDAVRLWLRRNSDIRSLHPAAFTIENIDGSSVVKGLDDVPFFPQVSIAYSKDSAIAIAHEKRMVVDMERIEERESAKLDTFTTPRERVLLQKFPPSEYHRRATSLWCAKKAACKVTETDINGKQPSLEATQMDVNGVVTVIHESTGRKLRINTQKEGDFIIAFTFDIDPP